MLAIRTKARANTSSRLSLRTLKPTFALALEGVEFEVFRGSKGYMRKDDHQFFQLMRIASFGELTNAEPFDEENTGWGWKVVEAIETAQTIPSDHLQYDTAG